jgi:hypothetical protein
MIKISLKGLAKFMTSNSTQQRKVLRDYKYPDPEGFAQATYYREARDFIVAYHRNGEEPAWLIERAMILDSFASGSTGQTKTRYKNNARALREYARFFAKKKFEVLNDINLSLSLAGVIISVVPDLHVREKDVEKIVKLEFTKDEPDDKLVRIISQAMYQAQSDAGMGLISSSVLYFDIPRGKIHKGARAGSRMQTELKAACENLSAIWDGI